MNKQVQKEIEKVQQNIAVLTRLMAKPHFPAVAVSRMDQRRQKLHAAIKILEKSL